MASQTSSNPNIFLLPDLGEGLEEAELLEWCVTEGQDVKESDMLAKMETAKAVVEVYSPRAGKVEKLHGTPGQTIKVGGALVSYQGEAGALQTPQPENGKPPTEAVEPIETALDDAFDVGPLDDDREDAGTIVGMLGETDVSLSATGEKVRAAPAVRRLARDLNVDITKLKGTGIAGRITSRDVQAAAAEIPPAVVPIPPQPVRPAPVPKQPGKSGTDVAVQAKRLGPAAAANRDARTQGNSADSARRRIDPHPLPRRAANHRPAPSPQHRPRRPFHHHG